MDSQKQEKKSGKNRTEEVLSLVSQTHATQGNEEIDTIDINDPELVEGQMVPKAHSA